MDSEVDEESAHPKQVSDISLEYREYEDNFETITVSSPQVLATGVVKGKYYKQTYRAAWEHMPDFKGKCNYKCYNVISTNIGLFRMVNGSTR